MKWFGCLSVGMTVLLFSCRNNDVENQDLNDTLDEYVVVVSFDGYRWDYADRCHTPNLDSMVKHGVKAERMIPSFPTKTFPNHYTVVTGLYPDHHGIINNSFYAEELGGVYRIGDSDMVTNPDAYFGEPIWVTAEQQGIKTASYFWVGSEAPIGRVYPSYWEKYNRSVPYADRVNQVIRWLKLPISKRPGLLLLYFDEPDHTGHAAGPEHSDTQQVIEYLDTILGTLRSEIAKLNYGDKVNLIVLSDHGMGSISPDRYVNLYDYIPETWSEYIIGGNPVYLIDPIPGFEDSITLTLNAVEGVMAWQKDNIPEHLHYGTSPRFPGIVVVADSGWSVGTVEDPSDFTGGAHGYDNDFSEMHTIFYAEGPAFKKGYTAPPFLNVEVYGIISYILGLNPVKNDGNLTHVKDIFSSE